MSTTNAAMVQLGDTTSQRRKKEQSKYQEFLPWESIHISPYIPKLESQDYRSDFAISEITNQNIVNSFKPFMQSQITPIQQKSDGLSEYLSNLDDEEQARFTMDQFRQFVMKNSSPELSSEAALLNLKYRTRLANILQDYTPGQPIQNFPSQDAQNQITVPAQIMRGSRAPQIKTETTTSKKIETQQTLKKTSNAQASSSGIEQVKGSTYQIAQQLQTPITSIRETNSVVKNQSQVDVNQSPQNPMNSRNQLKATLESVSDSLQKDLFYNYEKMLNNEGKLLVGDQGVSWNNTSNEYQQKLREWASESDSYIKAAIEQYRDVKTPMYLKPLIFRQVRPIDKVKRELISTVNGSLVPFETVVERRSVEVMHQRDYLIQPMFVDHGWGQIEQINEAFSFDRSFIVEQNLLTKSEILHEYPIHLSQTELFDFLFQTGIEVTLLDQYTPLNPLQQKETEIQNSQKLISTEKPRQEELIQKQKVTQNEESQPYIKYAKQPQSNMFDEDLQKKENIRQYFQQGEGNIPAQKKKFALDRKVSFDPDSEINFKKQS